MRGRGGGGVGEHAFHPIHAAIAFEHEPVFSREHGFFVVAAFAELPGGVGGGGTEVYLEELALFIVVGDEMRFIAVEHQAGYLLERLAYPETFILF